MGGDMKFRVVSVVANNSFDTLIKCDIDGSLAEWQNRHSQIVKIANPGERAAETIISMGHLSEILKDLHTTQFGTPGQHEELQAAIEKCVTRHPACSTDK